MPAPGRKELLLKQSSKAAPVNDGATAVVVLGHGSRAAGAAKLLEWVAGRLALQLDCPVRAASLQFNRPTLEECCRQLAAEGARRVAVAPYFLFSGNHLTGDIPGEIERIREAVPGVELVLTPPLGADERLVEVLRERITGAGFLAQKESPAPGLQFPVKPSRQVQPETGSRNPETLSQHPIEKQSFEIIDGLLEPDDPDDPGYQIVRRVVHTAGDPSLAPQLVFSPGAIDAGAAAIGKCAHIVCDVNMVAAGIEPTARRLGLDVICGVADGQTVTLARQEGLTRGAAAMRRLAADPETGLVNAIVAVGNAPTALFEVLRLAGEEGIAPALVVGVPVGFVGAAESKQALRESGLPHITLPGSRGGSGMAVAIVNALMRIATSRRSNRAATATGTSP